MNPTHTHKDHGGRFALIGEQPGGGVLEGKTLACYHDLDKDLKSVTTLEDWNQHWRPIARDDCPVCLGTGYDQIKGNKANPCGGCYGMGKVRQDGETPTDMWELADVALGIIKRLHAEAGRAERRLACLMGIPGVAEAREAHRHSQEDAQAEQERKWREGRGHGPGGARMTGD